MQRRTMHVAVIAAATIATMIPVGAAFAGNGRHLSGAAAREQAFAAYAARHGAAARKADGDRGGEDGDLEDQAEQYAFERSAPAASVSGQAVISAVNAAKSLPTSGGAWREMTTAPYNAEPSNFTDPFWGNAGAGFSIVGGRTTALVQDAGGTWFAGTADGGVWATSDHGQHWKPTFDNMPSLSIGALAVDPIDNSLWVGTGEANTSQDSYAGTGVYRSTNGGKSYTRVGNVGGKNPLVSHTVFQLTFDNRGTAYAATNDGLWRKGASQSAWTEVLDPAGEPQNPPYPNQVTSVQIVPGTHGQDVIAANAWRSEALPTNGFYKSTNGGRTFTKVTPTGAIDTSEIGRTTFAYSAGGTKLYAIVENPTTTGLQGIFKSSGNPASVAGPWTLIADSAKLQNSGSAAPTFGTPGVQTWYNQDLAVDPHDPNHVYAGLEEVYQSNSGGAKWVTASPYWNYNYACDQNGTCPNTTHPDQHAMMIANGKIVIGNDGGVYSRPLSDANQNDGTWADLNNTLRSLQYYDARAGKLGTHGVGMWGGLQDNGTSTLVAGAAQMNEAAGGDGFDVLVDPSNANRMAGEYTEGTMYTSTDGGHSFSDFISPSCAAQTVTGLTGGPRADCDPGARFVTPIAPDAQKKTTWLFGGQDVWVSKAGWGTKCTQTTCTWKNEYDTGSGNAVTALASSNNAHTIYAAWVGGGGNPGPTFARGIATNYGGTWHEINMSGPAEPLHRRRDDRPESPESRVRRVQRLLAALDPGWRCRSRLRDDERRCVLEEHLDQPPGHRLRRAGPVGRQAGAGHRRRRVHREGGPRREHVVVAARHQPAECLGQRRHGRPERDALRGNPRPGDLADLHLITAEGVGCTAHTLSATGLTGHPAAMRVQCVPRND